MGGSWSEFHARYGVIGKVGAAVRRLWTSAVERDLAGISLA